MANNEVLAGLQRAYLAAYPVYEPNKEPDDVVIAIQETWDRIAHGGLQSFFHTDADIRAWQPEQPDPLAELTRRVETLERGLATLSATVQGIDVDVSALKATAPLPAPEPDDPVCARCGHDLQHHTGESGHGTNCIAAVLVASGAGFANRQCGCPAFLPAPPAAPPLDPVLVKMAECYRLTDNPKVRHRLQQAFLDHCEDDTFNTTRAHNVLLSYGVPS